MGSRGWMGRGLWDCGPRTLHSARFLPRTTGRTWKRWRARCGTSGTLCCPRRRRWASLCHIVSLLEKPDHLTVISTQDYTLLCLLNALRVREYPDHVLHFGAFLLFECCQREEGEGGGDGGGGGELFVRIRICTYPFPCTATGEPERLVLSGMDTIVDDLPLESLAHVARRP